MHEEVMERPSTFSYTSCQLLNNTFEYTFAWVDKNVTKMFSDFEPL